MFIFYVILNVFFSSTVNFTLSVRLVIDLALVINGWSSVNGASFCCHLFSHTLGAKHVILNPFFHKVGFVLVQHLRLHFLLLILLFGADEADVPHLGGSCHDYVPETAQSSSDAVASSQLGHAGFQSVAAGGASDDSDVGDLGDKHTNNKL
uniref:Uncharacterized protein n=1 Tax=Cacopsylla melanoneura TaxID=428564 RepID=A0A8D9FB01_9HEMI